jgi:hypothetical protein
VIVASATALSRLRSSPGARPARARVHRLLDTFSWAMPRARALTPTQPSPIEGEGFEQRSRTDRTARRHHPNAGIPYAISATRYLSAGAPFVDQLAWGDLLEHHRDGRTHRRLVGRGARAIGIGIEPRPRPRSPWRGCMAALDLIGAHAGIVHRLPAGQDGVGSERLVHRHTVPAPVDRRMSETRHDLAAVLPDAEPVLISLFSRGVRKIAYFHRPRSNLITRRRQKVAERSGRLS